MSIKQSGVHPLHRAVASGDLEMVALLLEFGANANERAAWVRWATGSCWCHWDHELPGILLIKLLFSWSKGMVLATPPRMQTRPRADHLEAAGARSRVEPHRQGREGTLI